MYMVNGCCYTYYHSYYSIFIKPWVVNVNKILEKCIWLTVISLLIFIVITGFFRKNEEIKITKPKYHLEYIVDTLSSVCIVIIHQQEMPIGITEVDCILVPAGRFKVIEEGSYVGK